MVLADDDIEALGATLAALVPAVAEGVLRDAVVVDCSHGQEVRQVSEAAGTSYAACVAGADPWRLGGEAVKGPWLFLLRSGDIPDAAWVAEAERFLLRAGPSAARLPQAAVFACEGEGWLARLAAGLRRDRLRPRAGMLCPKAALRGGAAGVRVERLATRIRRIAPQG
ncbi:hypothetical protein QNA08_06220 [Chelatococcus sp. SYSU_G07232]|uniref:Glycosyltransferase n=1 Tax=Chelatococcus albus TaxID=3047466 RepID=A0ABT7AFE9_9HYPH|nr:hypothetical protein [Chelatococcus sp. SYSU_G07232]MDJ1157825.1 hypothetical protein [Chelatococcus sp. SYSU_G07232]